jgi:DNA-binding NtrC family response regulator
MGKGGNMTATAHVLVIADAPDAQQLLSDVLRREGVRVSFVDGRKEALLLLDREPVQVLFADLDVPGVDDEFVRHAASIQPLLSVVVLADRESAAVSWPSQGSRIACVAKPLAVEAVRAALGRAMERYARLTRPREAAREQVPARAVCVTPSGTANGNGTPLGNGKPMGRSPAMREILNLVPRIARTEAPVLIQGEVGTGKEMLAAEIHRQSKRASGPLVRVACGALRESELDDRLFGHYEESPGEGNGRPIGLLQTGHGGTLFLDDVSCLPFWAQVKLLDVLQQGRHCRFPSSAIVPLDVRVIASSTRDLEAATAEGDFYCALYYHLNVVRIHIPPLRHRQQDVQALAEHYLALANLARGAHSGGPRRFSGEAWQCLLRHDWPGNALQLASVVAHAVLLADGEEIGPSGVSESLGRACQHRNADTLSVPLSGGLKEMERSIIEEVIHRCRGNKAAAARTLGLHRRTLYRLLQDGPVVEGAERASSLVVGTAGV